MSVATKAVAAGLSRTAIKVDHALAEMDKRIDWLSRLTPINVDAIREGFAASRHRDMPDSEYGEGLDNHSPVWRRELFGLPVREIDDPLIETLLLEKQRELDRQIELVRMRDREGFIQASIDLFGGVSDTLLASARRIIANVPDTALGDRDADCDDIVAAAEDDLAWYRSRAPGFGGRVVRDPNHGVGLYTQMGDFHVATDTRVPATRVDALVQHEIGTHAVTRHNGRRQPLRTLADGLADYDAMQEGLAVIGEYLAGYLPPARLRVLAGRVIAAHMAVEEANGAEIYAAMREECLLGPEDSFQTALRAKRGGGLTKDAVYLDGVIQLLAYLANGGDFEILFLGKFALKQFATLEKLIARGTIHRPELLPRYLERPEARARLAAVRTLDVSELYQESPAS